MHQIIINVKVVDNDAFSAVISQHKCDVIVLTQEITSLVCMKILKTDYLVSG